MLDHPGRIELKNWFFLFVTEEILIKVTRQAWPSPYHCCSLLLGQRYHLTSIEFWSVYFDLETYTVLTHQRIQLLLAKSALSYWIYPTAQTTLFPIPSLPWVPLIDHTVSNQMNQKHLQ